MTNLYVDRYGVSDEYLTENFSDKAFDCLSKMHMFGWLNNIRPPKVNLPFTVSMFILVVKHSLSDTYSVSYETSTEAKQHQRDPLYNATLKTLKQAKTFGWEINHIVKPIIDVTKENIISCCNDMALDQEICDNVYSELDHMNEDLNMIRHIVLTPNNSSNNSISSDEDLTYPHVVQPSNITCLSSTSQHEINIIESPSPMLNRLNL